ncbi:MAG: hypothetical protein ACRD16_05700 [Thermoanaerobaculia bacterium]
METFLRDLIRFRARYYQLEASRYQRSQVLFHKFRANLHVEHP